MRKGVTIFSNQKGGIGKTTCCREISLYVASLGKKVCIIDSDPQGNLTKSLTDDGLAGLYEALKGEEYTLTSICENVSLLAGDRRLFALEKSLVGEIDAYTRLKELLLKDIFTDFEYIFIDSPPSLGILTGNGLAAATHIVIPMSPALYTLQGTNDLMDTISKVRSTLNPSLKLLGVIINAYDSIPVITRQIKEEIRESFGRIVFNTHLSKTIKIEEAIAQKVSVTALKNLDRSRVKQEVTAISNELLNRLEQEYGNG